MWLQAPFDAVYESTAKLTAENTESLGSFDITAAITWGLLGKKTFLQWNHV